MLIQNLGAENTWKPIVQVIQNANKDLLTCKCNDFEQEISSNWGKIKLRISVTKKNRG